MTGRISTRHVDAIALVALTSVLLPLYLATMYPDVLASGDTSKFQYLGRVLGTAHPPGYPTYIVLSHGWSWLPIGTLAWRMNLLSVVAGLAAVLCSYASARRLGAGSLHAALVAACLGLGRTYWEKLLAAEVYSLGALLLSAALWRILVWRESRRDRDLLTAVGLLAIGLGNHLTIAAVAPAFVVFALSVDWRRVLRWQVIAAAALLITAGVAQYGYVLLRTWQGAAHVEASASTLPELFDVVRASRYQGDMFSRDWTELAGAPLSALTHLVWDEVGWLGALAITIGTLAGAWRARPELALLSLSSAGVLALTLNVRADTAGFVIPALPPLWLLAALTPGAGAGHTIRRRSVALLMPILLAGAAAVHAQNFEKVDHHARWHERRLWTAVFEAVPNGTRVVAEAYTVDQSLRYMLYGEGLARRDIALIEQSAPEIDEAFRRDGRTVVASKVAADALRRLGFEFEPLPLLDSPIPEIVRSSRRDYVVIAALQPEAIPLLASEAPGFMTDLGGSWTPTRRAERYVVVGVPRNGRDAPERRDPGRVSLQLPAGAVVGPGRVLPVPVEVTAEPDRIRIRVDGRDVLTTPAALAVVVLGDRGQVRQRQTPASLASMRPRLATPMFRLVRSVHCEDVGDRVWHDISALTDTAIRVTVNNYRAYDATATIYLGGAAPFSPTLVPNATSPPAEVRVTEVPRSNRQASMATDGLALAPALLEAAFVTRLEVRVNDGGDLASLTFDLGSLPAVLFARGKADLVAGPRVRVCR